MRKTLSDREKTLLKGVIVSNKEIYQSYTLMLEKFERLYGTSLNHQQGLYEVMTKILDSLTVLNSSLESLDKECCQPLSPKDFVIGQQFHYDCKYWKVTDVGTRTIVAVPLNYKDEPVLAPRFDERVFSEIEFKDYIELL